MAKARTWGATPEGWTHFKRLAPADLLPVVSNPGAEISPRSKMKALGKTPSLYVDTKDGRRVIGFTDWTDHFARPVNIDTWSREPDYGICLQTRRFRAFDIDVDDEELADELEARILELLGLKNAPTRIRSNSGKRLILVLAEGELSKQAFPVKEWEEWDEEKGKNVTKRWLVELLATGQQFIAAGTHTSGARYEWRDGLPEPGDVPVVSIKCIERTMATLKAEFAVATWKATERHAPTLLEDLNIEDPVGEYLIEQGLVLGEGKGMLFVECPWIDGHSSDSGETQTAWLLAGSGRYRNGHFSCRHAGCSGYKDPDFLQAIGYRPARAEEFEDLSRDDGGLGLYERLAPSASPKAKELKASREVDLPPLDRTANGFIDTNLENVYRLLRHAPVSRCDIALDTFRAELMVAKRPGQWTPMSEGDPIRLRARFERLGLKNSVGKELMRDALTWVGEDRQFDSAQEWLEQVVPDWDGVSRIYRFFPDYLGTADTPYTRALGDYLWTALAGRVLDPGCQVDYVPVLVGEEGLRKTSAIKALVPDRQFYASLSFDKKDVDLARLMRGKLVGELAELRGVSARDGEAIKEWVTKTEEEWTPTFMEKNFVFKRRLVLIGTTNDAAFLQPHMGWRRWLPVMVERMCDTAAIERDRLQLWAEARDVWGLEKIAWESVERLAKAERGKFKHLDPWSDRVARWLDEGIDSGGGLSPRMSGKLRIPDVLVECLRMDLAKVGKHDQMRMGEVLKDLGMVSVQKRVGGRNTNVWLDAEVATQGGYANARRTSRRRS